MNDRRASALPWAVLLCLTLAACGGSSDGRGGSGGMSPGNGVDTDGDGNGAPVDGLAQDDPVQGEANAAGLLFEVVEDGVLIGALADGEAEASSASPFSLLSQTTSGTLELLDGERSFRYVPDVDFNGEDGFEFATTDARVLQAIIDVTPAPDAPVFVEDEAPFIAELDLPFARMLVAHDVDGEPLRFEASGLPGWLTLDPVSGTLSGTPEAADRGRLDGIVVGVVDPTDRRDERTDIVLEVVDAVAAGDRLSLDLTRFPATLAGGERLAVDLFDDDVSLAGQTLVVEGDPALGARIDGRSVMLAASDVEKVTDVVLELSLTDTLGRTVRADVPLTLLPTSPSGRGTTLLGSRSGPGVHLVVLGDGYLAEQQDLLRADAVELIDVIRADPGIAAHVDALNVHVVESVSRDEGALPPGLPDRLHSTAFGSRYDCEGVAQLICADVVEAFMQAGAEYDVREVVLFVNDVRFGGSGSGGGIAIASRGAAEVALHELGHSMAGLADEYVDGALVNALAPAFVEGLFPNVTAVTDRTAVPWAHWFEPDVRLPSLADAPGVGLFEGGLYRERGVFRPTGTSRMREFERPFGPVNSEQWVLALYRHGSVVRAFDPRDLSLELAAGESREFSVTPFFPPEVQSIEWRLNGERVARADGSRMLEITPPVGTHRLQLQVRDVSGAIRLEPPHSGVFDWTWTIEVR